ncbi:MAG: phosphoglycerate kinase [Proteobacteria bacterium]|nr:phosphoglycerate kinase [Pseudomonadota bacterium]
MAINRFISINDLDLGDKRVLLRVDFNVPIKDGSVVDDSRIQASITTIRELLEARAKLMLMSHLGRPEEGIHDKQYSLAPVACCLSKLLQNNVPLITDWQDGVELAPGELVLWENVRFEKGEKANDDDLARQMAAICDVYVNDAFATAHRAQASTHGVAKYAPVACAGPLLIGEVEALSKALEDPAKPLLAIVGGAKVSTKLTVLESLLPVIDQLILGGGIANTFLLAAGYNIGHSLHEPDLVPVARDLMATASQQGKHIPLPVDVVCAMQFSEDAEAICKTIDDVKQDDLIMDIGPKTARLYAELIDKAATIVWNGPLGVFEFEQFAQGTKSLANAIAKSDAFSLAGGGDTLSAINSFGVSDDISYISTGGGAFLEFIEGKQLPAISMLEESARAWYTMERARED